MFLAGSRWVSSWLNVAPTLASANDYAEGSPVDRAVFSGLIVAGIESSREERSIGIGLVVNNKWIILYLVYCLASIAWTDDPTTLMKRSVKELGNPIMALVILTEPRPYEAIGVVLRRLAFLMLPLSVLFVRYYPELGRSYHPMVPRCSREQAHQKNTWGRCA